MQELHFGLNSFQLKVIALVLMTFDHVAYFLSGILPIPWWFHLIGRLSAPLFIFVVANGFRYTHNRLSYMKRLYVWSVFMALGNSIANLFFQHPDGAMVINNIFATMFYIVYFLNTMQGFAKAFREKRYGKVILYAIFLILPFALEAVLSVILFSDALLSARFGLVVANAVMALVPLPLLVEGSIFWIILGIGFYFCLEHKIALSLFYVLFSSFFLWSVLSEGWTAENLFVINNQWFMVFSLPLLLFYNKQRGRGMKYLFYFYYPIHVYALLALAHWLA